MTAGYAFAADVTADFSASSDASPTTAAALNSGTTNGSWSEPVISNTGGTDYFRTANDFLEFDINTDASNSNATTTLSWTTPKNLNGTTVVIDLNNYTRGGVGQGGAYFIGKDSADKELFKIYLACGQTDPKTGTVLTNGGLRRGVAYVDKNGDYIRVTSSDDLMQNGGVYTVTLGSSGYTYGGNPDAVAGPSDAVVTPSVVDYNTNGVVNIAKVELIAFNDSARSGMQFSSITVSGNDYVPTTIATFNGDDTVTNPLTDATVLNAGTVNGTWSSPVIVNGGTESDLVPTFGILSNALKFDSFNMNGASATTELTLTESKQLDGTVVEINLKDMLRAGGQTQEGGIFVTGKNSSGDDMFKLYFACGQKIPTGFGGAIPTQMGLAYINAANDLVNVSSLTKDLDAGGIITLNLSESTFEIITDPTTPKDSENPITTVSGIGYRGTGDLKSIELDFRNVSQNTGAIFDNLSIIGETYVPPASIAGHTLALTGSSSEVTFNHAELITSAMGSTSGIADQTSGHWTCEFWLKLATSPTADTLLLETSSNRLNIGIKADNTVYLINNGNVRSSSAAVTIGSWTHVAIIGNESANGEIFINGVSKGNTSGPVNNGFRMNKLNPGNALGALGAEIDEFRVWTTARTGSEILTTMDKTFNFPYPTDLALYYNFDDLITVSRGTTGQLDELTGNTDGSSNTADSVNSDNTIIVSTAPIFETVTPVLGLEITQTGTELTWTVTEEVGVKEYQVIDSVTGELIEVVIAGTGTYSLTLPEGVQAKIVVVDESGFTQTFFPENGNSQTTVYDLEVGWNLIAITGENADLSELGIMWVWTGSAYAVATDLAPTQAAWVYSTTEKQVVIKSIKSDASIELESGWNMVGPTQNCTIPESASIIYSWNQTYDQVLKESDLLIGGVGYWIFNYSL